MMFELLWLLLPVAAASGWFAARRAEDGGRRRLTPDYFRGLHYLLNDQPDRAIEVFIKVLEIDEETAETQLALGNLYRRRGEVDRAIRLHQNLVARPALTDDLRLEAHLELAQDYLSAGCSIGPRTSIGTWWGRRPTGCRRCAICSTSTSRRRTGSRPGTPHGSWPRRRAPNRGRSFRSTCAKARCRRSRWGSKDEALELLRSARDAHPACARASLHEGDILSSRGSFDLALASYRRIENQDADYLPEVIGRIQRCFDKLDRREAARGYLERVLDRYGRNDGDAGLAEMIREQGGNTSATHFMLEALAKRPTVRGFDRLLDSLPHPCRRTYRITSR